MYEKIGLWLAYWVLRLTGNRDLANISRVLPAVQRRHWAICSEPLERRPSPLLFGTEWWLWDPERTARAKSSVPHA